jgi:AcrR family transcriptional regulator
MKKALSSCASGRRSAVLPISRNWAIGGDHETSSMRQRFSDGGDDKSDGRRGYHHGNLKEALIAAALDLVAAKGVAGFTFADAARHAGVSPAAPYRHYRDRDMLLADVAARGFQQFADRLQAAWDEGRPSPLDALKRMGPAYLAFARKEQALYSTMFESGIDMTANADCRRESDRAFNALKKACEALVASSTAAPKPPVMMMALHIWSISHGTATLYARGDNARQSVPISPEDLLEAHLLIYLDGLGIKTRS